MVGLVLNNPHHFSKDIWIIIKLSFFLNKSAIHQLEFQGRSYSLFSWKSECRFLLPNCNQYLSKGPAIYFHFERVTESTFRRIQPRIRRPCPRRRVPCRSRSPGLRRWRRAGPQTNARRERWTARRWWWCWIHRLQWCELSYFPFVQGGSLLRIPWIIIYL